MCLHDTLSPAAHGFCHQPWVASRHFSEDRSFLRLLSLQNSKGSSSSALGTWAEGQWRGGCRDKGQDGNASCQLPAARALSHCREGLLPKVSNGLRREL